MNIQSWTLSKFVPYFRNPRKNDHKIERMADSINQFGFKIPILARSDGEVIDGDLRLKAAKKMGLSEVPVIVCDDWTPAQVKAFRLMVNRSATWAQFDLELVALEMKELEVLDFNLELTGFDPPEIDKLLFGDNADATLDAKVPEPEQEVITQTGDVWVLGAHRVCCGDATSKEAVGRLLGPVNPGIMITDPPYGVEYDPRWRERAGLGRQRQTGMVANDDQADWAPAFRLFPGDVAYVWHAGLHAGTVAAGLELAGFRIRSQIIWAKQHFALSRGDYHWEHEPAWYAVRDGKPSRWRGDRTQSTLWKIPNLNPIGGLRDEEATGHGTQKPIELMRRPILNHTGLYDEVYDPFLGSGTTLIAAELTERLCYGMEIDPRYVDVIVRRWQNHTGRKAVLEADGHSFDEVGAERASAVEI